MGASSNAHSVGEHEAATEPAVSIDPDLTVHIAATVPISGELSPEAKEFLKEDVAKGGLSVDLHGGINEVRAAIDDQVAKPNLAGWRSLYAVNIEPEIIAGVQTDVITPRSGLVNEDRVLINLHGGGFIVGARFGGQVESVPMAGIGRIKVITVDYRQAPEYRFPAGSEDVAAVYKELLKTYEAKNIGIYGSSAGGFLTAEAVAWFQTHNLPKPGAIGIFCGGGLPLSTPSDSSAVWQSLSLLGVGGAMFANVPLMYFNGVANDDPLAWPATSPAMLSEFPPTLVMASTRDPLMGNAVLTHTRLVKAGVEAQLYIQEGLGHAFMASMPKTPEAIDAYTAAWKFFDTHLGR